MKRKRVKLRIDTGVVCEQYVYQVPGSGNAKARPRFRTEAERVAHREELPQERQTGGRDPPPQDLIGGRNMADYKHIENAAELRDLEELKRGRLYWDDFMTLPKDRQRDIYWWCKVHATDECVKLNLRTIRYAAAVQLYENG